MFKKVYLPKILKFKNFSVICIIAASNVFFVNAANATMYVSGQGNYASWCSTYLTDCQGRSIMNPAASYQSGQIDWNGYSVEVSANLGACSSAYSLCMSNPIHSTSSPSGYIFRFDAVLPY
jgi:hypothetical protein